jgi:DNA-binding NarL/FixJ family response regulator
MDISMPVMSGIEATRRIKAEMPYVKIVMVTVSNCESCLFEAVKSGAQAYLPLRIQPDTLFGTLRAVVRGEAALSPGMAEWLLEAPAAALTAREREVLGQVAQGRSNKEIAAALAICESAVKNHLANVLEKLHLESRAQAPR